MPADPARTQTSSDTAGPLAVIAGSGALPRVIAQTLSGRGREVLVIAVEGEAEADFSPFRTIRLPIGAASRLKTALRSGGCRDVLFAGAFRRPRLSEIEFDLNTMKLALSSILKLRYGGDDRVLGGVARIFENEGFRIVGPREAVPELLAPEGPLGRYKPNRQARDDIAVGVAAIAQMGALDIGQTVAALDGRVIAVEAAEGTSAMIDRCGELKASGRLPRGGSDGVVVKMVKPGQELRLDLPVVGTETIEAVARAGLAGLAVEAGGVLLVGVDAVREAADRAGIFVHGVAPPVAGK